jgi:hypothetical protein
MCTVRDFFLSSRAGYLNSIETESLCSVMPPSLHPHHRQGLEMTQHQVTSHW